jgi:hypothetical protein
MATSARYFDLMREMKDAYDHHLRLVESAKQRGIKPTARLFATTVPTVHKWLRRFQQHGPSGLVALPRARDHQSQKTPPTTEAQLVKLAKRCPFRLSPPDLRVRFAQSVIALLSASGASTVW